MREERQIDKAVVATIRAHFITEWRNSTDGGRLSGSLETNSKALAAIGARIE